MAKSKSVPIELLQRVARGEVSVADALAAMGDRPTTAAGRATGRPVGRPKGEDRLIVIVREWRALEDKAERTPAEEARLAKLRKTVANPPERLGLLTGEKTAMAPDGRVGVRVRGDAHRGDKPTWRGRKYTMVPVREKRILRRKMLMERDLVGRPAQAPGYCLPREYECNIIPLYQRQAVLCLIQEHVVDIAMGSMMLTMA
jgi:hypothetical protein